ncbi:MAG: caspase family protein [Candidatus Nanoarchaeia archaeon]|nr:caspase family protein [Candidatus Nanoarchaeia archaeon]MDD5358011.1 caspase family protein [Candidatus Nanoarchaeia archaeon]MDD5588930.1 caspase family protein [Candidatus Nanoarchaeia archaeon]
MKKKALLVYGNPNQKDNPQEFYKNCERDIKIMSEIAEADGYDICKIQDFDLEKKLQEYTNKDMNSFLFYFTGHACQALLGNLTASFDLDPFFELIDKIKGEKIVILDSCTQKYIPSRKFSKNTKVFGGDEIDKESGLSKLFFDAVMCYNKKLEEIDKKTFDEMKHNWVYVGEVA